MASNNVSASASTRGIGTFGLLGVVFVVAKLLGLIGWSWWWVTAPFWAPPLVVIACVLIFFGGLFVFEVVKAARK